MFDPRKALQKLWSRAVPALTVSAVVFGMLGSTGCSTDEAPVTPEASGPPMTLEPGQVTFAHAPSAVGKASLSNPFGGDWYMIGMLPVSNGVAASGNFSRYSIDVPAGQADFGANLTVYERAEDICDLRVDGSGLSRAITITIDYAGTNVDPDSPNYDGSSPTFYSYDDVSGLWLYVEGSQNAATKTYEVEVGGGGGGSSSAAAKAGRYALFGTGDW